MRHVTRLPLLHRKLVCGRALNIKWRYLCVLVQAWFYFAYDRVNYLKPLAQKQHRKSLLNSLHGFKFGVAEELWRLRNTQVIVLREGDKWHNEQVVGKKTPRNVSTAGLVTCLVSFESSSS